METDNPRGIALMAVGMGLFALADTIAKGLLETYPPLQVVFLRQLGLFVGVTVFMLYTGRWYGRTEQLTLQVSRGLCAAFSALAFLMGLAFVPLADATSIAFVAPLFVIVLSYFLLQEPVGARRWIAVVVGFSGTLVIIRPGFEQVHWGHLLIIAAAFLFALRQVISRKLASTDVPITTALYTAYISVFAFAVLQPLVWVPISDPVAWLVFAVYAGSAGAAEFMVIRALQISHAIVAAPVQYTILIWVSIFGFLAWGILPDLWTVVGAVVIAASGLYSLYREWVMKRGPDPIASRIR